MRVQAKPEAEAKQLATSGEKTRPESSKGMIKRHLKMIDFFIVTDLLPLVIFLKYHPRDWCLLRLWRKAQSERLQKAQWCREKEDSLRTQNEVLVQGTILSVWSGFLGLLCWLILLCTRTIEPTSYLVHCKIAIGTRWNRPNINTVREFRVDIRIGIMRWG